MLRLMAWLICLSPSFLLANTPNINPQQFKQNAISYTYQLLVKADAINIQGDTQYTADASAAHNRITIKASAQQMQGLNVSVEKGVLTIVDHNHYPKKATPEDKVYLNIGLTNIKAFTANEANGYLKNLDANQAFIKLHNATMLLRAPAKSNIAVNTLTIRVSGKSSLNGVPLLTAANAVINASDQSKIKLDVTNQLTITASGNSSIGYAAPPKSIKKTLKGQAKLKQIDTKDLDFLTIMKIRARE